MKMKFLFPVILVSVIVAVAFGMAMVMVMVNDDISSTYEYVPSDITKANPNIKLASGSSSFDTINPSEIKDKITHTVIAKVKSVGNVIPWQDKWGETYGAVPVTLKVKEVVKGDISTQKITVYLHGMYEQGEFYLLPNEPQFEINEKVLVHLNTENQNGFKEGALYVQLAEYGKYKIVDEQAYNKNNPNGKSLDSVKNESK